MFAIGAVVTSSLDSVQQTLKDEEKRKIEESQRLRDELFLAARPKAADCSKPYLKHYMQIADFIHDHITNTERFRSFFRCCILLSACLMGIQTYNDDGGPLDIVIAPIMNVLVTLFTAEVALKVVAESTQPCRYFAGPSKRWNTMDLIIVLITAVPINMFKSVGKILRMLRLAKVAATIKSYRVFILGIVDSAENVFNISALITLIMYMYAVTGVLLFRANDPWHFGSLHRSFFTLFSMTTMDGWSAVMYTNMYGCGSFGAAEITYLSHPWHCKVSEAQPVAAAFYCISFVTITGLVMLSMFIGVISISMSKVITQVQEKESEQKRQKVLDRKKKQLTTAVSDRHVKEASVRERNQLSKLTAFAVHFIEGREQKAVVLEEPTLFGRRLHRFAKCCSDLESNKYFDGSIFFLIGTGGILAGLKTYFRTEIEVYAQIFATLMTSAFTFEMLLKIAGEADRPWRYLYADGNWQNWNLLDFGVVMGSYIQVVPGDLLMVFRMLLVLKIMKLNPSLRVTVDSFLAAVGEVSTIGSLISLAFFFFALLGITLFKDNDPGHFKNLHIAMLTLFRVATLDNWSEIMSINMYGCAVFQDLSLPATETTCDETAWTGGVAVSAAYFASFVVVGTFILLNLFIGVIIIAMEKSMRLLSDENDVNRRAKFIAKRENYTNAQLTEFRAMFDMMDADGSGSVNLEELTMVVKLTDSKMTGKNLQQLIDGIDADCTGEIDFAEFIEFMNKIKKSDKGVSSLATSVLAENKHMHIFARLHDLEDRYHTYVDCMNSLHSCETKHRASSHSRGLSALHSLRKMAMSTLPSLQTDVRRMEAFLEEIDMISKYRSWKMIQEASNWEIDLEHSEAELLPAHANHFKPAGIVAVGLGDFTAIPPNAPGAMKSAGTANAVQFHQNPSLPAAALPAPPSVAQWPVAHTQTSAASVASAMTALVAKVAPPAAPPASQPEEAHPAPTAPRIEKGTVSVWTSGDVTELDTKPTRFLL
jgi:voltage-gated sodium channel